MWFGESRVLKIYLFHMFPKWLINVGVKFCVDWSGGGESSKIILSGNKYIVWEIQID